jgi:hypothetical protein
MDHTKVHTVAETKAPTKAHAVAAPKEQLYKCPACDWSTPLSTEALAHSAVFCPVCRIHRETKDMVPVKG